MVFQASQQQPKDDATSNKSILFEFLTFVKHLLTEILSLVQQKLEALEKHDGINLQQQKPSKHQV
jgi:hypothetical protein